MMQLRAYKADLENCDYCKFLLSRHYYLGGEGLYEKVEESYGGGKEYICAACNVCNPDPGSENGIYSSYTYKSNTSDEEVLKERAAIRYRMIEYKNSLSNIQFKTKRQDAEFTRIVPKLLLVVVFAYQYYQLVKVPFIVTCVLRTALERFQIYGPNHPEGVHEWHRGIDISIHGLSKVQKKELVDSINEAFPYDPERPEKKTAMIHEVNTGGEHLHLQVMP